MRLRLALALLPAILIGSVAPAAAAGHTTAPVPGTVVVHQVGPVAHYRLDSWDPVNGSQLDSGSVRVAYTCYPSPADETPGQVVIFASASTFHGDRFGETVPCDGKRKNVQIPVVRGFSDAPDNPGVKSLKDTLRLTIFNCICGDGRLITEYSSPIRVNFHGFDVLPFPPNP